MSIVNWCGYIVLVLLVAKISFESGTCHGTAEFAERYALALADWRKKTMRKLDRKLRAEKRLPRPGR